MTINLRDIQYFAVIAKHRHLGKAAEVLGLSQPALSMSLRRLERVMQTKLVKKTPKGVDLTISGEAVYARAHHLEMSIAEVLHEVADLREGQAGHIRISTGPGLSFHFLPAACAEMLREAAKVKFTIEVTGRSRTLEALRNGELDIAILTLRGPEEPDLIWENLYDNDAITVFASTRHPLVKKKRVTLADVAKERWALGRPHFAAWQHLHKVFADHGFSPPRVAVETSSTEVRYPLIASTDILGYGSASIVRKMAPNLHIAKLRVKELDMTRGVGVVYRKQVYLSQASRRFIEILKLASKEFL